MFCTRFSLAALLSLNHHRLFLLAGRCGLPLFGAVWLAGCQTAPRPPVSPTTTGASNTSGVTTNAASREGYWHSVRIQPRADLPEIHTWNKFNPIWWFKNVDDPVPPDWYRPNSHWRNTTWGFRNPLHNLTFYVIGVADKEIVRSGRYPRRATNPNGGWNFSLTRRRIVVLPYVSYKRGRFEFYLGWRVRGNFGAKINVSSGKDLKAWQNAPYSPDDPYGLP